MCSGMRYAQERDVLLQFPSIEATRLAPLSVIAWDTGSIKGCEMKYFHELID